MTFPGLSVAITLVEERDDRQAFEDLHMYFERPMDILQAASDRVGRKLRMSSGPVTVSRGMVRASGFSGIIRLTSRAHIEVIPKIYKDSDPWREDLFFMTGLSRYGTVLPTQSMGLEASRLSYPSVVAEALAEAIIKAGNSPLRTYRSEVYRGFELVGDVEPFDLAFPDPDGVDQRVSNLTDRNAFMGTIAKASAVLLTYTRRARSRQILAQVARSYDHLECSRVASLPSHAANWSAAYTMAKSVLFGRGHALGHGAQVGDVIVRGADLWDDVLWTALRQSHGAVRKPRDLVFARRILEGAIESENMLPTPDFLIKRGPQSIIVDAKYKTISNWPSASDIYEIYAFCKAAQADRAFLLYPSNDPVGLSIPVSSLRRNSLEIKAIRVGIRGISMIHGLRKFKDSIIRLL